MTVASAGIPGPSPRTSQNCGDLIKDIFPRARLPSWLGVERVKA